MTKEKKIYRMYNQKEYTVIRKKPQNVHPGDLVVLNFNSRFESINPINTMAAWYVISGNSQPNDDGTYYVLKPEPEVRP